MKQIIISEKCNGCGMCVIKCPNYFEENDDGDAQIKSGVYADNSSALESVINECPVKAISLGNDVNTKQSALENLDKLKEYAKGIPLPSNDDIKYTEEFCSAEGLPFVGISRYEYKSRSAAEKAGLNVFSEKVFSHIDDIILRNITNYRVNVIKPYYSTDENSVYTKFSKKVSDALSAIANIVGKENLPSDFCKMEVCPERDWIWEMFEKGEILGANYIGMVKKELTNSKASDYRVYIDTDDMEDYKSKKSGKYVYNYDLQDAVKNLKEDLTWVLKFTSDNIEDWAIDDIKGLIGPYNRKVEPYLKEKITAAEAAINKL